MVEGVGNKREQENETQEGGKERERENETQEDVKCLIE